MPPVALAGSPGTHAWLPLLRGRGALARAARLARSPAGTAVLCLAAGAASLSLVAPAPSYDPWAWLLWGRELTSLELSTAEGPAFKPLPVFVCSLLSVFGGAAPLLWLVIARAGAVLSAVMAFRVAQKLSGGSRLAGAAAAVGVLSVEHALSLAVSGSSEPLGVALMLLSIDSLLRGRHRTAFGWAAASGLLRVEMWPFLLAGGILLVRSDPRARALVASCLVVVPALWFLPEWAGSGNIMRSSDRALIPNPGNPALAAFPFGDSLWSALKIAPLPLFLGLAALALPPRRSPLALLPAALGAAWLLVVAAMAQVGYSGEERYALAGIALIAVSAGAGLPRVAGWARLPRALRIALPAAAVAVVAASTVAGLPGLRERQAYQARLVADLPEAITAAGGRGELRTCGNPYVGNMRGPLLAYHLAVEKRNVRFDVSRAPGVVFRSRLSPQLPPAPALGSGFRPVARVGTWEVLSSCG